VARKRKSSKRYAHLVDAVDQRADEADVMVGARIVRWIEDSNLSLHDARVMLTLAQTGRPMSVTDIADQSGLDIDTAYQTIHSLHGRGLTGEDCRCHGLTDRGRELMESFAKTRREGVKAYLSGLGEGELRKIESALDGTAAG
jgi:DNA-binding MarR family transcriptional regulator